MQQRRRQGFTLVELLVAIALLTLLVAIVADAFSEGMAAFRQLKGTGDLQERLRTADLTLRQDLLAHHFDGDRKVSNLSDRPRQGYFFAVATGNLAEGLDADGLTSYRSVPGSVNWLAFTVRKTGRALEDYHATFIDWPNDTLWTKSPVAFIQGSFDPVNPGQSRNRNAVEQFHSRWAEVAYFLSPTGQSAGPQGSSPLFALHRRQKLLIDDDVAFSGQQPGQVDLSAYAPAEQDQARDAYLEVSHFVQGTALLFNRPDDVATPPRRGFRPNATPSDFVPLQNRSGQSVDRRADDVLMTDVLSFTVELMIVDQNGNRIYLPNFGSFDTNDYDPNSQNLAPKVTAIRITLRVWDFKTEQARQVTIVQDL